jgi:hypothetical protein
MNAFSYVCQLCCSGVRTRAISIRLFGRLGADGCAEEEEEGEGEEEEEAEIT